MLGRAADVATCFESAIDRHVGLNDLGEELRNRANLIESRLSLLDAPAASDQAQRIAILVARTSNADISLHAKLVLAELLFTEGRAEERTSF